MKTTDDYKKQLLELRAVFTKRMDAIHKDTHHTEEPVEKDFAEQVVQRENDDVLNALGDEARQTVTLINNALHRIESGDFGYCLSCGEAIAEERLNIVPFAEYCVKCADKPMKKS
ncbi:MAG TPA: TraR/DksA family transcriptional regulator [Gammaproteobacteria bacterium]